MANRNANQNEPVIAAAIVPMIAEVNGLNRQVLAHAAELPPEARNAPIAIAQKINEIWGILLGKDLTRLEIPDEAVAEIAAVIERYARQGEMQATAA